jgi:hypothetical protein
LSQHKTDRWQTHERGGESRFGEFPEIREQKQGDGDYQEDRFKWAAEQVQGESNAQQHGVSQTVCGAEPGQSAEYETSRGR